jgi:hypothetical protein
LDIKCVFHFFTVFVLKFSLSLKNILQGMCRNACRSSYNVIIKHEWFKFKFKWIESFCKIHQYQISWKFVQWLLSWNIQTDGQTDMTSSTCINFVHIIQRTHNNQTWQELNTIFLMISRQGMNTYNLYLKNTFYMHISACLQQCASVVEYLLLVVSISSWKLVFILLGYIVSVFMHFLSVVIPEYLN